MVETSKFETIRPWCVIVEQAAHEFDTGKMSELMREQNQAGRTGSA